MPRKYTHIKQYEDLILQLKEEGYSHREIGEMTGFTKEQIRGLIKRRNRMSRKIEEGYVPKQKDGHASVRLQQRKNSVKNWRDSKWKTICCGIFSETERK